MPSRPQGKFVPLRAILIKKNDFGEGSSFFTAIDRELGKIRFLSFGSSREKSARRSSLLIGNLVTGVLLRKPDPDAEPDYTLKEIAAEKTYPSFTRDLKKMSFCFLLFETLDLSLSKDEPFTLFDELLGTLDRAEDSDESAGYFLRMIFLLLRSEGVLPDNEETAENLQAIFSSKFSLGNGTVRFLNDCFLHGNASCMDGKKLSPRVVQNLLDYLRKLTLYHYRREPASLDLIKF
jgi:recombinational DNA repair protein (RecF pathway)